MKLRQLILAAAIVATSSAVSTANAADAAAYEAAKKEAAVRYAEDKKLCAEESTSKARMQCLRDAKAEYGQALKTASETYNSKAAAPVPAAAAAPGKAASGDCAGCGTVVKLAIVEKKGESTPLGMIAGGVAGAMLGHQVGGGRGKDVATIAGAAGGAYAGHKIEEHMKSTKVWVVGVRFEDGMERDYQFAEDPHYSKGDTVKRSGETIMRR